MTFTFQLNHYRGLPPGGLSGQAVVIDVVPPLPPGTFRLHFYRAQASASPLFIDADQIFSSRALAHSAMEQDSEKVPRIIKHTSRDSRPGLATASKDGSLPLTHTRNQTCFCIKLTTMYVSKHQQQTGYCTVASSLTTTVVPRARAVRYVRSSSYTMVALGTAYLELP